MWVLSYEESGKITEVFSDETYDKVYDEMVLLIKLFLKPNIPYLRHNIFEEEKKIQVDFGNHTRFFWIEEKEHEKVA